MLNSTDDAISVRDASSRGAGGVGIWPKESAGCGAWVIAQGGVSTCPGLTGPQADAFVSITKAEVQSTDVKRTTVPSALRFFMFSPLGLVTDSILETKKAKDASEEQSGLR
jgi:hypothetical protein